MDRGRDRPQPDTAQSIRIAELRRLIGSVQHDVEWARGGRARDRCPRLPASAGTGASRAAWDLGLEPAGSGGHGLGAALASDALHEIKPADPLARGSCATGMAAAAGFALLLMIRRLHNLESADDPGLRLAPIVWCASRELASVCGRPHAPGLARAGLDPSRLLLVDACTRSEALWAVEESLKSASLAGVVALVASADLTQSRRLALAAAVGRTPCLVVTAPRGDGLASTATRWRVETASSLPSRLEPTAPGRAAFAVTLEKSRQHDPLSIGRRTILEWCDDAYSFHLAAGLADRSDATRRPERSGEERRDQPRRVASGA